MKRDFSRWVRVIAFVCVCCPSIYGDEHGKLSLYFLRLPVGQEIYDLTKSADGLVLRSSFAYTERQTTIHLDASLRMKPDGTPQQFSAEGKSYRPFSVHARFIAEENGEAATVLAGDASSTVKLPDRFFTLSGYAPLSVQMMLLRYWDHHGRPERLPQYPAATPDADLRIEVTGHDIITINGRSVQLTRYSIRNVVWGRESVWLEKSGAIAAATTYAGGLPFEAIQPEYASALPQLIASATSDRLRESTELKRSLRPVAEGSFAIVGATLIDGTDHEPITNAAVIVRNGKIMAVGLLSQVRIPRDVLVIRAVGATLLPGLWDMHAHFAQVDWGPTYLAAGVTSARDCGNEFEFITAERDAIARGQVLGPRLLLAGLVDGSGSKTFGTTWADTPDQGRAAVARYKAAGFVQMKIYDWIQPEVLRAVAAEAHRFGMTVTGHVPRAMAAMEAVDAGMDQINHIGSVFQSLRGTGSGPLDLSSAAAQRAVRFFQEHGTVIDPTMSWNELLGRPMNFKISSFEPGFARAPYVLTSLMDTAGTPAASVLQPPRFHEMLQLVKTLYDAGVPIVAGTDKGIPGHSLHRELELYVEAGLTPMQVIRLATQGAARAMRVEHEVGTIEAGKRADLILVEGNPLEDFSALRRVTSVVTNGRMYKAAPLWQSVDFKP